METGFSPEEVLTINKANHAILKDMPVWGCPTYVLHPTLQNQGKRPKQQQHSRRTHFMGLAEGYASNVVNIRLLKNSFISPQFHVVFDYWFESVHCDASLKELSEFDVLFTEGHYEVPVEDEKTYFELHDDLLTKKEIVQKHQRLAKQDEINQRKISSASNTMHAQPKRAHFKQVEQEIRLNNLQNPRHHQRMASLNDASERKLLKMNKQMMSMFLSVIPWLMRILQKSIDIQGGLEVNPNDMVMMEKI